MKAFTAAGVCVLVLLATSRVALGQTAALPLRWIGAALDHHPGVVDAPLIRVSGWSTNEFGSILKSLAKALADTIDSQERRNEVLRRGVLLHTDIALLTPDRAAMFTRMPVLSRRPDWARPGDAQPSPNSVVLGRDGQYLGSSELTAHWAFARALVDAIRPDPSTDPFVVNWYRATTATFQIRYWLGYAAPHLDHALKVLPADPWILFYKGAMHEAAAAPRLQNIARSRPRLNGQPRPIDLPRAELGRAEEYFTKAMQADSSFAEAHLRLGRVLGLLGRHPQALDALQRGLAQTEDPVLRYFGDLFSAAELESLGRAEEARQMYERCAAVFPSAHAPLLGLSELARRTGDRAAALLALERVAALADGSNVAIDPWWIYLRSYARNADQLLDEVRRSFLPGGSR